MTTTQRVDVERLSVSVERLPPIERDEQMQRDYIPIPGGWEVQTKGNGSTYRIARTDDDDGERWPVTDRYLQDALTNMAHAIRADYAALLQQLAEAERAREEAEQDRWRTDWPEMKPLIDSPPSIWRSERVIVSLVGGRVTHDVAESFDGKRPLWFIHRDKVRAWQPFPAAFLAANGGGK